MSEDEEEVASVIVAGSSLSIAVLVVEVPLRQER
jgi:hypothetical protein